MELRGHGRPGLTCFFWNLSEHNTTLGPDPGLLHIELEMPVKWNLWRQRSSPERGTVSLTCHLQKLFGERTTTQRRDLWEYWSLKINLIVSCRKELTRIRFLKHPKSTEGKTFVSDSNDFKIRVNLNCMGKPIFMVFTNFIKEHRKLVENCEQMGYFWGFLHCQLLRIIVVMLLSGLPLFYGK